MIERTIRAQPGQAGFEIAPTTWLFCWRWALPLQWSLQRRPNAALVQQGPAGAKAAYAPRATWLSLLRTVTAFTLGHSITLMLATLGWTQAWRGRLAAAFLCGMRLDFMA